MGAEVESFFEMQMNRCLNQRKKITRDLKITRCTGERRPQQVKGGNHALLATPWSWPIDHLKLSARFRLQDVKYWTPSPVRIEITFAGRCRHG